MCERLGKLAENGLTCGPKCNARARWDLTAQGRELAATGALIIDALDKQVLTALCRSPMRHLQLARLIGCCSLTARRRVAALVERGLVSQCASGITVRYAVTDAGRQALGDAAPRPWVRIEAISAALARDVRERQTVTEMTTAERAQHAALGRQRALVSARLNRSAAFNAFGEFDRMTGWKARRGLLAMGGVAAGSETAVLAAHVGLYAGVFEGLDPL